MLISKISVNGVHANAVKLGTLTTGMVGAKVQFTFDSSWEGLSKTAVFRCMDITKDVLNIDSEVTIPHEVLVRSGSPLYVGVYGTNADGDLVIPTRWATVGIVYSGADPSGDPSTERSPDVWEQLQNQINELKNQGADADAIKQAVDAYMAANPQTDELQNAVNVALAQAKESGEFDGSQGPQGEAGPAGADGKDGQPGADGKDYVLTESDKTEIAEQAAGLVEVPESGGIEVTGASVGQIIVVKAVDDNGKPTEWETADLPQGGGGETAAEAQLATGTIEEGTAAGYIDTGVTLATLKKYKRFTVLFKGAVNTGANNVYLTFSNKAQYSLYSIARSGGGGWLYGFEWLNIENSLLRTFVGWSGNPSLMPNIGTLFVRSGVWDGWGTATDGNTGLIVRKLSGCDEANTLRIYLSEATKTSYAWEVRGLTV